MTELPGGEPVLDDELLYRRIPVSTKWYDLDRTPTLEPEAFRPNRNDDTGISVSRAKYKTVRQAATGRAGRKYYVAVVRARDLRGAGMEVAARPLSDDPSHAEITSLTYGNRKLKRAIEWRALLAELARGTTLSTSRRTVCDTRLLIANVATLTALQKRCPTQLFGSILARDSGGYSDRRPRSTSRLPPILP